MMMTFVEVKGQQRSNIVTMLHGYQTWSGEPLMQAEMMMTFVEKKGQQRSNTVNNALWLPNLVRRTADASYE